MPTSLVDMLVTCDREIVEEEEAEKGERDDGEMDNNEVVDLSDSDDELWLICSYFLTSRYIALVRHSKLTHDTYLAMYHGSIYCVLLRQCITTLRSTPNVTI